MHYSLSWSGGKDSTASVILAHEHGEPVDSIVFAETMYCNKRGISGENPLHIDFIKNTAIPLFESWGYNVHILHSDRDFLSFFNRVIENPTKHAEHKGKKFGFPPNGMCGIKRDCKIRAVKQFYSGLSDDIIQYVGIGVDEVTRLNSLHKTGNVSLLEKYGYTQAMARGKCLEYGLLSPIYNLGSGSANRGGCWFCPYAKIEEHCYIKEHFPKIWDEYVSLENEDVAYPKWNLYSKLTLKDIDDILSGRTDKQLSIFEIWDSLIN